MGIAAEPTPAKLPLPGSRRGATVRVSPLLTGTASWPPGWAHSDAVSGRLAPLRTIGVGVPKSEWLKIPLPAFLVEHPGAGPVLIDTGMHSSVAVDKKQNLGRFGARVLGTLEMETDQAVAAQLRKRGIEPSSVEAVIMTHLHLDHASAMSDFGNATFLFSSEEWASATYKQPWRRGYVPSQFDHAFDYRTLDFDSDESDSFETFGRSFDVFGDGSVRVVFTPGHTRGHMSVILRLKERDLVVAGDAVYTERNLNEGVVPGQVEDSHLWRRSQRELQLYAREHPDAIIVPGHDMEAWNRLQAVYE